MESGSLSCSSWSGLLQGAPPSRRADVSEWKGERGCATGGYVTGRRASSTSRTRSVSGGKLLEEGAGGRKDPLLGPPAVLWIVVVKVGVGISLFLFSLLCKPQTIIDHVQNAW